MKKYIFTILILICIFPLTFLFPVSAASGEDRIVFLQTENNNQILYISNPDGSELRPIAENKKITAFFGNKHLLYYCDHKLFAYDSLLQQSKFMCKFAEDEIWLDFLSSDPGTPDQALIYASDPINAAANWYILELSDGSIRRVDSPPGQNGKDSNSISKYNSANTAVAVIKQIQFSFRFNLEIQEKSGSGFKTVWSLPRDMTVIPEAAVWAPNSRMATFYAKKYNDSFEGFYGLYLFNLDTRKLQLIQDSVFSRFVYNGLAMKDFTPAWSNDSRSLICQYQPFDLPDESSILKYETATGKKYFLNNSKANKKYPTWSPSDEYIAYLSYRDHGYKLYVVDADGNNMKMLSPSEGQTEWAKWIQ